MSLPPLRRSVSNSQSRRPAFGRQHQPNFTSNVNGAQTASAYDPSRRPPVGVSPNNPQWMASRREAARMNPGFFGPGQPEGWQSQGSQTSQSSWGEPVAAAAAPAPVPYAGGDVAGQAQYYRNTALGQYRPPGSSNQQAALVNSLAPGTDMNDPRFSGLNGYDTFSAQMDDPNRLTPNMKLGIASRAAQGAMNYDPTNQGGNRFAGSAARIQAAEAHDQAAIAAGTQAERQRMQEVAADSQQRAMDPNSTNRQFAYQDSQGRMVATNRLGALQQMNSNDPGVQVAIAEEKQRQSALGKKQEDFQERYAAAHGGLGDKDSRRLRRKNQVINRAVRQGIIQEGGPDGAAERRANAEDFTREQGAFRTSERQYRRSALDAANAQELQAAAGRDNARLPNGQLRPQARQAARDQLAVLTNPALAGNDRDRFHSEIVLASGMSVDPAVSSPQTEATKIMTSGIQDVQQALAFQKYWKAMSRSDADWAKKAAGNQHYGVSLMDELASIPEAEVPQWLEKNKDRLKANAPLTLGTPLSPLPTGSLPANSGSGGWRPPTGLPGY